MAAGAPGDHPLTDLLSYGLRAFPDDIEALILSIAAITPEALHDTKLRGANWFAWARGEDLETARRLLSSKLRELEGHFRDVPEPRSRPPGFLAVPPAGAGPGVLVLHAWWGLNDTVKAFCRRLADAGFVTFAPDLYRGKVADNVADAEILGRALDARHLEARSDIEKAVGFLGERAGRADRGLAVIGFSLGAYYALSLAAADPGRIRSVVLFYGTGGGDFSASRAAYLGHFAGNDPYEPESNVGDLEASLLRAGRLVTFHRYPGAGHWFFEPDRTDAYDPDAATLAWERTLAFLRQRA